MNTEHDYKKSFICCNVGKLERMGKTYIDCLCMCFLDMIKRKIDFDFIISFEPVNNVKHEKTMNNCNKVMTLKTFKEHLVELHKRLLEFEN